MEAQLNVEQVAAFLEILRDSGVEEFEGFGFHVKFSPNFVEEETEPTYQTRPSATKPPTLFETPTLWPGGQPPKFQKDE
jgi:hypothetical protein